MILDFAVEHPFWFLGLCGVIVSNAIVVWRLNNTLPDNVIPIRPEMTA